MSEPLYQRKETEAGGAIGIIASTDGSFEIKFTSPLFTELDIDNLIVMLQRARLYNSKDKQLKVI